MSEVDPEEKQKRINESMARLMQILTFFGHVDNFLTQKTHNLIKIMGKAVDSDDEDYEEFEPRKRYRKFRRPHTGTPRITTTVSS